MIGLKRLQLVLSIDGIKLKSVKRVFTYKQSTWLKPYIEMNSELRQKAQNDFEKDFFKLMNNSIFGKMMENVFNRRNIMLLDIDDNRLTTNKRITRVKEMTTNLLSVEYAKEEIKLDKPVYVGFQILDRAKWVMEQFWYKVLKPMYDNKVQLCMTDTDSFIIYVETEDLYQDMCSKKLPGTDKYFYEMMDISEIENKENPLYKIKESIEKDETLSKQEKVNKLGKKIPGLFKDETLGYGIEEFVGIRSKMYSLLYYNSKDQQIKQKNVGKGIPKGVLKKVKHDVYKYHQKNLSKDIHMIDFYNIRSHNHQVYTVYQKKTGLVNTDDKRFLLDPFTSNAHGHIDNVRFMQNKIDLDECL